MANPTTEPEGYDRAEQQERIQEAGEDKDACDTDDGSVSDGSRSDWGERQEENEDEGHIILLTPTENDIFCGRGKGIGTKPGNEKYVKLIGSKRAAYLKLPKKEKQAFAEQVLKEIETQWSPPGRFLEHPVDGGKDGDERWKILSKKRIIVKICTALRKGPESNNSRKRMQAAKRKEKLEQKLKHQKQIFPDSCKEKVEKMKEESKLTLQKPFAPREADVGCDELDDEKKMRHTDSVYPVPRRVTKRTVPASSVSGKHEACESDARRVARKTSPSASASNLSPFSFKEGNDQRVGLSCLLTSTDDVRTNDKYSPPTGPCKDAAASPAAAPPLRTGCSAPATGITSQSLNELLLAREALKWAESCLCSCGGIVGSMPTQLSLLAGRVSPPHCICSRILASRILCLPSLSYVPRFSTHISSLNLAGAPLENPTLAMPPQSAVSVTIPQIHEGTKVPEALMATMPSRTPLRDSNSQSFAVCMQNVTSHRERHQYLDAATLFLRTVTHLEAATTVDGRSSAARPRDSDGEDIKEEPALQPVSSSPSKDTTPSPLCQDVRTNARSETSSEFPTGTRHLLSVPHLRAPSRDPPLSTDETEHKVYSTQQRQEHIDAVESEVSKRQAMRPAPALSSTRMNPHKNCKMARDDACTNQGDKGIDLGEDDVFGDAEEDDVLRNASDFHLSAAFMGRFSSSC